MEDCVSFCICELPRKAIGNNMFSFKQNEGLCQHRRGGVPTKQEKIDPLFARTNTFQTQNSRESALFEQKPPCFGNFYGFYSYPTDMPTHREVFGCIWIMDLGPKSSVRVVMSDLHSSRVQTLPRRRSMPHDGLGER